MRFGLGSCRSGKCVKVRLGLGVVGVGSCRSGELLGWGVCKYGVGVGSVKARLGWGVVGVGSV